MSKTITRKYIQRITKREGNTNIRQSSGGGGGGGGASQYWVEENYISKLFFNQLFTVYDEDGNIVEPNDTESVIASIKSMFGFWTDAYLSALGNGEGGGAELTLASLADVDVQGVADGQALVWNATTQKWVPGQGGGIDITAMWAALAQSGTQQIDVSHLGTALTGYATESWVGNQGYITSSALNGYATESWVGSQISDMATKTWVSGNYLSKTDAAATYVSIAFFERLFKAYNGSTVVHPNNTTSTIDNIKAMFGFWTEFYLSALGNGSGGSTPGVTMAQVWSALGNSTTEQINISHLTTALSGYNPTSNFKTINGNSIIGTGNLEISGGDISNCVTLNTAQTISGLKTMTHGLVVSGRVYSSGDDEGIVVGIAPNNFAGITLGTYNGAHATLYYENNNQSSFWRVRRYVNDVLMYYDIQHPLKGGTIALTSDIPTNVSQLTNDSGYLTSATKLDIGFKSQNDARIGSQGFGVFLCRDCTATGGDGAIMSFDWSSDYCTQFYLDTDATYNLSVRNYSNGTWNAWKEIITSNNIASQSVAFATKANGLVDGSSIMTSAYNKSGLTTTSWFAAWNGYELRAISPTDTKKTLGLDNVNNTADSDKTVKNSHYLLSLNEDTWYDTQYRIYAQWDDSTHVRLKTTDGTFDVRVSASDKLVTARTIWGQNFDGTGNVSGAITGATTINASSNVSVGGTLGVTGATSLSSTLGVTGATTLSSTLSVSGTSTLTGHVGIGTSPHSTYVLRANGEVYVSTGLYSHGYVTALSDIRHKDIQGDVGLTVNEVANAPAVKFLWKDRRQDGLQVGSIAQYWQKVLPEAIVEAADGELTMSYGVIALLASIANAREIVNLKREIAELKRKLQIN